MSAVGARLAWILALAALAGFGVALTRALSALPGALTEHDGSLGGLRLARAPYVGVACPGEPDSMRCDRVGVAVWLRRPAAAVLVTVDGCRAAPAGRSVGPCSWMGWVHPAGLMRGSLHPPVRRGATHWSGEPGVTTA
jgi:hypothetical protein